MKRYALAGDYAGALSVLDAVLAARPTDTDALILRGNVLDMMGEGELARAPYESALSRDPGNIRALIDLAELDEDSGRCDAALMRLDLALTLLEQGQAYHDREQEFEEVFWAKYRCAEALGRDDEALRVLKQAVKVCPNSTLLRGLLERLQ